MTIWIILTVTSYQVTLGSLYLASPAQYKRSATHLEVARVDLTAFVFSIKDNNNGYLKQQ